MFDRIKQGLYWDKPLTLVSGCTPCSPGCRGCWSASMSHRFTDKFTCYTHMSESTIKKPCGWPQFNGHIQIHPERLDIPLKRKKPTVWAIWNDFFHEDVSTRFIDHALEVMAACPQHIFLLLTKRAYLINKKMYAVTEEHGARELGGRDYIPNLWLGVTVCNQEEADEKIPLLLQIPAAVRFISIEPMLGLIDLLAVPAKDIPGYAGLRLADMLQLVIVGGESGPGARPMHPDWVRSVRDQCQAARVLFFFKQWGEWLHEGQLRISHRHYYGKISIAGFHRVGKKLAGRLLDRKEWNELPEVK